MLIPLIFAIYYNHDFKENYKAMKTYLIRAILFTFFQSGTKGKLQKLKKYIKENDYKFTIEMLDSIYELRVTDSKIEDILNSEKGSRMAGEALYYLSHEWLNENLSMNKTICTLVKDLAMIIGNLRLLDLMSGKNGKETATDWRTYTY